MAVGPISGVGAIPAAGAAFNELTSVTRRCFSPRLWVQMYFATPTLFHLMGNAQRSSGGLDPITFPIQGQSMVQGSFTGYGGGFNQPAVIPGIQNAQFPTCYWVVPIPLPFGETVIQATEAVIPILKARMNDAYAVSVQNIGNLLFQNNTASPLLPSSFIDGFDNGTNVATYAGINRNAAGNTNWQGQYYNVAANSNWTNGATRANMAAQLIQITDNAGGEAPTYGVMNPSDFARLNADFIGNEETFVYPGRDYGMSATARSGFPNLNVAGVPIYSDHFCPKGQAFFPNSRYTSMYMSEDAAFDFSGFYSLVPLSQIGQQGVVILGYNICTAKPVSNAYIVGIPNGYY